MKHLAKYQTLIDDDVYWLLDFIVQMKPNFVQCALNKVVRVGLCNAKFKANLKTALEYIVGSQRNV